MFTKSPHVTDEDLGVLLDALSAEVYKIRENLINFIVSMSRFGGKTPKANAADVAKAVDTAFSGATLKGMFIYPRKEITVNNIEIDKGFNVRVDGEVVLRNLNVNSFYDLFDTIISELLAAKMDSIVKAVKDAYKMYTTLRKASFKTSAWADGPYDKAVTKFFFAAFKGAKPKDVRVLFKDYDLIVEVSESNLPNTYRRTAFTFAYKASDDKFSVSAPKELVGKKYGEVDDMIKDLVAVLSAMNEGVNLNTFSSEWARNLLKGA